nr:LysR family transcriptional regulator [uncultured Bacillus sp.]
MNYAELKTFVTLAEIKNFTRTAEILMMSQPSVSLHIKNLEEEFQTKLFLRSPKVLKITPTGEILYDRAKLMLSLFEQTKQDILEHHHIVKGELKIGASFTIGEYVLPSIIAGFKKEFPNLELQIVIGNTEEIVQYVKLFQVDIGLIEGQTNEKDLSVHPFMQDQLFITAPYGHPLTDKEEVSILELQNQEWIARESGSGTRLYFDHMIRANGIKMGSLLTISSNQGIKEAVINGMGLSLLSYRVIEREVQYNTLSIISLKNFAFKRTFSYIYSPVIENKKNVKIFIQTLQNLEDYVIP